MHTQLTNRWWLHLGGTLGQIGTTYCDRCARGGPAIRQDPFIAPWGGIEGDSRHALVPYFWVNYFKGDQGHAESISLQPELDLKVSSRFTTSVSANWNRNWTDNQYFGTFADSVGTDHYTFAHLVQRTLSLTWRLGYTSLPPLHCRYMPLRFITKGTYTNVREIGQPRAASYHARYQPYADPAVASDPGGFNFQQFRSNVVFRWEYRAGSTLFLVWSQGRQDFAPVQGTESFGRNPRRPLQPPGQRYFPGEDFLLVCEIVRRASVPVIWPHPLSGLTPSPLWPPPLSPSPIRWRGGTRVKSGAHRLLHP